MKKTIVKIHCDRCKEKFDWMIREMRGLKMDETVKLLASLKVAEEECERLFNVEEEKKTAEFRLNIVRGQRNVLLEKNKKLEYDLETLRNVLKVIHNTKK